MIVKNLARPNHNQNSEHLAQRCGFDKLTTLIRAVGRRPALRMAAPSFDAYTLGGVGPVDEAAFIEPANDAVVDDFVNFDFADFRTS